MGNRYQVSIDLSGLGIRNLDGPSANALCDSTSLPGRNITTFDYQAQRQSIKLPSGYANEDVTLTWILTNDFAVKNMFDAWMQKVVNTDAYRVNYNSTYVSDVTIYQLDKNDRPIYGVTLQNAYPITANGIELNNAAENTVQRYTVTLTYADYVVIPLS